MSETATYSVPAIHCDHCAMSIREEVSEVEGVDEVAVDLDSKLVTVTGHRLDGAALRAAIVEAGYEAE
jgi:copper chaperone